ncbi:phytoene/squalene synthase family protein [Actinopolymorpha sp. B17G11]|uniref:phytoene/squalene synthase family protein n=1 Tax=Actinopolymorpha sp. B17G11 TaxID=3160861 RepID=UPI0032E3A8D3
MTAGSADDDEPADRVGLADGDGLADHDVLADRDDGDGRRVDLVRRSYRLCGRVARHHGKTYAMAARLLSAQQRRDVHAVYAFCRVADDIVDDAGDADAEQTRRALAELGARFRADLARGESDHPVLAAVVETARRRRIDPTCFERFLRSMAMDLDTTAYDTWDDLMGYMDGSAAVIGEMMLPVLRPYDATQALGPARDLGIAFQLTNFLRDVGEDLDRGRIYVPQEDLARFGVDPRERRVSTRWRALMRFEIERNRRIYASADAGIPLLPGRSARCVHTARILYSRILDRIEAAGYDVFSTRVRVPGREKAAVAVRSMLRRPPSVAAGSPASTGGSASRSGSASGERTRTAGASGVHPRSETGGRDAPTAES